jgi:hypothetical protein
LNVLNQSKSIAVEVFTLDFKLKVKESPLGKVKVFQNWDKNPQHNLFLSNIETKASRNDLRKASELPQQTAYPGRTFTKAGCRTATVKNPFKFFLFPF